MDKWCSNCDRGHFDTQILLQNYWNREHFEPLHLICAGMFIAMRISAAKGAFPLSTSGKDKEADHVAKQSLRRLWVAPHHQRLRKEMHSHVAFRTGSCDQAMARPRKGFGLSWQLAESGWPVPGWAGRVCSFHQLKEIAMATKKKAAKKKAPAKKKK